MKPSNGIDMNEQNPVEDRNEQILAVLLRQIEADKLVAHQWNTSSLVLIYIALVAIIILELQHASIAITTSVAVVSLVVFIVFNYFHRKRLEQQILKARAEGYRALLASLPANGANGKYGGNSPLSARELQILRLVSKGYINKQIAMELNLSPATVRNHVSHIMQSLEVDDRTSAVVVAIKNGWISLN